jgi:hypothetical protein
VTSLVTLLPLPLVTVMLQVAGQACSSSSSNNSLPYQPDIS